ncbi:MAG TPA: hypothetical protein VNT27_09005 [Propionibacteriaceae bacterium]|nr:hypothetical protein [Propionibacteriaceae bacterium]
MRSKDGIRAAADAADAELVVLRVAFARSFGEDVLLEALREGVIVFPADQVTGPFVDLEDVAEVAFTVLTGDGRAGRT